MLKVTWDLNSWINTLEQFILSLSMKATLCVILYKQPSVRPSPACQWWNNEQSSGSRCHGVHYVFCSSYCNDAFWRAHTHKHTQKSSHVEWGGQGQVSLCFCPEPKRDMKEHQKAGDKKWERKQKRNQERWFTDVDRSREKIHEEEEQEGKDEQERQSDGARH